jgi:putative intracellular protease/amidase
MTGGIMSKLLAGLLMLCSLSAAADDSIAPYQPRFGRAKPVIAVIGENSGTELTDFTIPYGVLSRSEAAEVLAVATQPGPMTMRPALTLQPQATVQQFDARFPDGADYVIVPAVVKSKDAALLAWVSAQAAKGATMVSICDGALVLANSGLLRDHRATAHWATESYRKEHYPDTQWISNTRYVADGKIITSAGISAAMPTSLALVEAIAGHERAASVAREVGVSDWSTTHDSDRFHPGLGNLSAYATIYTNSWFHSSQSIGVPVAAGIDEITLAFTADAWSRTARSRAYAVADGADPILTRSGLAFLPERATGGPSLPDVMLPAFASDAPAGRALDRVLDNIASRYGSRTAFRVALDFEYPSYQP